MPLNSSQAYKGPLEGLTSLSVTSNTNLTLGFMDDLKSPRTLLGHLSQVNLWSRSLAAAEVIAMSSCEENILGDIFSTDRQEVVVTGDASVSRVPLRVLCEDGSDEYLIFPEQRQVEEARVLCRRLGSRVYNPQSLGEIQELYQVAVAQANVSSSDFLLFSDIASGNTEGDAMEKQPSGENCIYFDKVRQRTTTKDILSLKDELKIAKNINANNNRIHFACLSYHDNRTVKPNSDQPLGTNWL